MKKIVDSENISSLGLAGKTVVFTNGCFDIIHKGHIEYLRKAKALGDLLIVGVNSDESVRKIKGEKRPIMLFGNRASVLTAMEFVDFVISFDEETPLNLIKQIKPDILVKGADYGKADIVGADFVLENGGEIVTVPLETGFSTTDIINTILERYCNGDG